MYTNSTPFTRSSGVVDVRIPDIIPISGQHLYTIRSYTSIAARRRQEKIKRPKMV